MVPSISAKVLGKHPIQKQVGLLENTNIWPIQSTWQVQPYNKVDEIAAHHGICYDMGKAKSECDREMVKSLDEIPYVEMPKWGQIARFLINTKQKLGLGVSKDGKRRRATGKINPSSVISLGACYRADLSEMQQFSKCNKG